MERRNKLKTKKGWPFNLFDEEGNCDPDEDDPNELRCFGLRHNQVACDQCEHEANCKALSPDRGVFGAVVVAEEHDHRLVDCGRCPAKNGCSRQDDDARCEIRRVRDPDWFASWWHVDDVADRARDMGHAVTRDEARDILRTAIRGHDASRGLSWDTFDEYVRDVGVDLATLPGTVVVTEEEDVVTETWEPPFIEPFEGSVIVTEETG